MVLGTLQYIQQASRAWTQCL